MSAICITGMHRSGTSMVARLLGMCGVHLGEQQDMHPPAADNPLGYWEHAGFVALNERILELSGTSWGLHLPLPDDWLQQAAILELQPAAEALMRNLAQESEVWGWKDPRNSLTLPFWQQASPEPIRVVHCLRHPADVSASLSARGQELGDDVWMTYNESLIKSTRDEDRIVTHYDAYFHDAPAELRRVLDFLGMTASDTQIAEACATVRSDLRHAASTDLWSASPAASSWYLDLCREAGPVFAEAAGRDIEAAASEPVATEDALAAARVAYARLVARAHTQHATAEHRRRELTAEAATLSSNLQAHVEQVDQLRSELLQLGDEMGRIKGSRTFRLLSPLCGFRSVND